MALFDALARLFSTALRLVLWAVAAGITLVLIGLALVFFLSWLLVGLALGRKPQVSLRARVQRMREFSGGFRPASFRASGVWGSQVRRHEDPPSHAEVPVARRIQRPAAVQDVEVKETRPRTGD